MPEIDDAGHGGNYLTSQQTLDSLQELTTASLMWESLSLDAWKEQNMPTAEGELTGYAKDIFASAKKTSENDIDIIIKGEEFIRKSLAK